MISLVGTPNLATKNTAIVENTVKFCKRIKMETRSIEESNYRVDHHIMALV